MLGLTFLSAVFTIVKATYLNTFNDRTDPCKSTITIWLCHCSNSIPV
jgi:hypothetical protein